MPLKTGKTKRSGWTPGNTESSKTKPGIAGNLNRSIISIEIESAIKTIPKIKVQDWTPSHGTLAKCIIMECLISIFLKLIPKVKIREYSQMFSKMSPLPWYQNHTATTYKKKITGQCFWWINKKNSQQNMINQIQ